jgi:uncharacterized protein involved in exopolysaccharide biosynthesis
MKFLSRLFRRRKVYLTSIRNELMTISDEVQTAMAKLDLFVSKETANEAELASLKSQLDAANARADAAEASLATAQISNNAANDAAVTAAADAAAIQPLLDKISALPVA